MRANDAGGNGTTQSVSQIMDVGTVSQSPRLLASSPLWLPLKNGALTSDEWISVRKPCFVSFSCFKEKNLLIFGGLIGISLILLQDLISIQMDTYTTISIISFSISIPLLVFSILNQYYYDFDPDQKFPIYASVVIALGIIGTVIGITTAIWYATWIGGIVFLISGSAGFATYAYYKSSVEFKRKILHQGEEKNSTRM